VVSELDIRTKGTVGETAAHQKWKIKDAARKSGTAPNRAVRHAWLRYFKVTIYDCLAALTCDAHVLMLFT
jgi:hypothetical protein